jgi:hypothetical protein
VHGIDELRHRNGEPSLVHQDLVRAPVAQPAALKYARHRDKR